jgi:hypothetical protein
MKKNIAQKTKDEISSLVKNNEELFKEKDD